METVSASALKPQLITAIIYGAPGMGKTTTLGHLPGKTLVLDVDRTTSVLKSLPNAQNIDICYVNNITTWDSWNSLLQEIVNDCKGKYDNIAVDNISELERCILSSLGRVGKNNGIPCQADYQFMQFKIVNSLRYMKTLDANLVWTAWETTEEFQSVEGQIWNRYVPQLNRKIYNNICGLCNIVGRMMIKEDGTRGISFTASNSMYAKNQYDKRLGCRQESLLEKASEGDGAQDVSA